MRRCSHILVSVAFAMVSGIIGLHAQVFTIDDMVLHDDLVTVEISESSSRFIIEQSSSLFGESMCVAFPTGTQDSVTFPPLGGHIAFFAARKGLRAVPFTDAALEAAVREAITNKNYPTNMIYDIDLLGITSLDASSRGITNLDGLWMMQDLEVLNLGSNELTDTGVYSLPHLQTLHLHGNPLTNLTLLFLGSLQSLNLADIGLEQVVVLDVDQLAYLDVSGNQLTNIWIVDSGSNLALNLSNTGWGQDPPFWLPDSDRIAAVDLRNNNITNTGFYNMDVRSLDLRGNVITNIDMLAMDKLENLNLAGQLLTDIDLADLPALTNVDLSGNLLTNITVYNAGSDMDLNLSSNLFGDVTFDWSVSSVDGAKMDLRDNGITNATFVSMDITDLDLRENVITGFTMYGLSQLKNLNLENQSLGSMFFSDLYGLTNLDLSGNLLTNIYIFDADVHMTLDLSSNALRNFQFIGTAFEMIGELDLRHNLISNAFLVDLQITSVDLRHNAITNAVLLTLDDLKNLNLQGQRLQHLDLGNMPALTNANLSGNRLTNLFIFNTGNNLALNLSSNKLGDVAFSWMLANVNGGTMDLRCNGITNAQFHIMDVTSIDLRENQITNLGMSQLDDLRDLNLEDQRLTYLRIEDLPRLRHVNLSGNLLTNIHVINSGLGIVLDLSSNQLGDITFDWLSTGAYVTQMDLRDNGTTNALIANIPQLQDVDLSGQQLRNATLTFLPGLTNVNLSCNMLTNMTLYSAGTDMHLDLSSNQLGDVSFNWDTLGVSAGVMDLRYNGITNAAFHNMDITSLDLRGNHITNLDMADLNFLETLNLQSNQLVDLVSLAFITTLTHIDLTANLVTNLDALIGNAAAGGLGVGDQVLLYSNPLSDYAITNQIPILQTTYSVDVQY